MNGVNVWVPEEVARDAERYEKLRYAILHPEVLDDPRFAALANQPASNDALDALIDLMPDPPL